MSELLTNPDNQEPYRVLARKYRPYSFSELIGQEAMVRTLTNSIEAGRLPQAWMLTGVRGIGKTTTARIIAKALNCTGRDPQEGSIEPCGACDACLAITEDRHVDVQEMDAASRTGVDDIREIIDSVRYGPVSAKYKIYILDEVHMLSKNAFNALLKTLEEPPPHTKFIFATTEIRKVPVTVLSRCQRFDLRRIEADVLTAHFTRLAVLEKADSQEEAIKLIARAADGSVRDGLSLLDQAIALGNGDIKTADVKEMLGLADRSASLDLCAQLLRGEMETALNSYSDMMRSGTDPLQLLQDMASLVHFLTRAQIVKKDNADVPEAEKKLAENLAHISVPALTRAWQILLKGVYEVQMAANPVIATEMVLIRLAYAAEMPLPGDLIRMLREEKEKGGLTVAPSAPVPTGGTRAQLRAVGGAEEISGLAAARQVMPENISARQSSANQISRASAVVSSLPAVQPSSFREVVELFATNREAGMYAELCSCVHFVRMSTGNLEISLAPAAKKSLITRVEKCLTQWTTKPWSVAIVDEAGEPTLQEQEKQVKQERENKVQAHPLMQACQDAFPEAKMVSLKEK